MTETKIRPAVPADAGRIAELCSQLGYANAHDDVLERIREATERRDTTVLVAEEGGNVEGWIQVSIRTTIESGALAEITGLVVDAAVRRSGIGGRLVQKGEEWAGEAGHNMLRVRTNVLREDADKFYRELGFKETKRQTVFQKKLS